MTWSSAGKTAQFYRRSDQRTEKQRAHARQWSQGPQSDAWLRERAQLSGWEKLLRELRLSEAAAVEELRQGTQAARRLRSYVERLCHK